LHNSVTKELVFVVVTFGIAAFPHLTLLE
jgi:hypothetical protein